MKPGITKSAVAGLGLLTFTIGCNLPATAADSAKSAIISQPTLEASYVPATQSDKRKTDIYIVQFVESPVVDFNGNENMAATKPAQNAKLDTASLEVKAYKSFLTQTQNQALQNCGVNIANKVYEYTVAFSGMAARMTEAQAALMRAEPNVLKVVRDQRMQMDTDSTREFLELNRGRNSAWRQRFTGEDVIVGVLDSGINPEHPSFADVPTPRRGDRGRLIPYGPAPEGWSGDECDFGNTDFNPLDVPFECNNKVLGGRTYSAGFLRGGDPATVLAPGSSLSARDDNGHGSAAASNAIGNYGVQAIIGGEEVGSDVMSGVAPRARVAAYKVCWDGPIPGSDDDGCFNSDSMAAIDQAVADGVDVINFSIGGSSTAFSSLDAVAFLFAANAGVHVATSAGNSGPDLATTGAPAVVPWITSVGAINDNQNFALGVEVNSPANVAGLKTAIEGAGTVQLEDTGGVTGDIVVAEPADGCTPLTNAADISGNIALVIRGTCAFDAKYAEAEAAGAVAIVVYNDGTASDRMNPFAMGGIDPARAIPGVMIGFSDGDALAAETTANLTLDSANQISLTNRVVDFSSRGPNRGAFDIIKPDVVAPGVNILSAETTTENEDAAGGSTTTESFQFISGTSFSSPHVAGVLALIKQANPDWSPAVARSAIMTTARQDLSTQFSDVPATPFEIGAGHVVPNDTFEPGLAYDVGLSDYAAFTCGNNAQLFSDSVCEFLALEGRSFDGSELNLPSIGVGELLGSQTVNRTVTNVDEPNPYRRRQKASRYKAVIDAPEGIDVKVSPRRLRLRPGESADYSVTFTAQEGAELNEFSFGSITWVERGKKRRYHRQLRHDHPFYAYWAYIFNYYGYGSFYRDYYGDMAKEVRSPIAVRPVPLSAPADIDTNGETSGPDGVSGEVSVPVQFGYNGDYTAALAGIAPAIETPGSVTAEDGLAIISCFDLTGVDHLRMQTFDEDTGTPGSDDLDLRVIFLPNGCSSFDGFSTVGSSGNATSNERIDIANPGDGSYLFVVDYFAAANGGTSIDYNTFVTFVAGDLGNATIDGAPTSASSGSSADIKVNYVNLAPDTRHLGIVSHQDENGELGRTVIGINTR